MANFDIGGAILQIDMMSHLSYWKTYYVAISYVIDPLTFQLQ